MKKMSHLDRLFLLITGLLAAYQVVSGVEGLEPVATWALTIAFGVLLVTGLLLIILGFETLESPLVVIACDPHPAQPVAGPGLGISRGLPDRLFALCHYRFAPGNPDARLPATG